MSAPLRDEFAAIEARTGGRLGVAIFDTGTSRVIDYRGNERFAMCSTFKCILVGAVLARVDRGAERMQRLIVYSRRDLLPYAPATRAHLAQGAMSVAALCEAAMTLSDNTAANLLLRSIGGPAAVTQFARGLGDRVTRLDRSEPDLNTAIPGDLRDTTSPLAMARTLHALTVGAALTPGSRARLTGWLRANTTGDDRLRAGLPRRWVIGDKTGTGGATNAHGASDTRNDIAIVWPHGRSPLLVTAFLTRTAVTAAEADRAIADVGATVAEIGRE